MFTGISLIRNGTLLKYPYLQCIDQLFSSCKRVIVNCDPGEDDTLEQLMKFQMSLPIEYTLDISINYWDMENTGDGSELARQANLLLDKVPKDDWVIYCQADELIHEKDAQHFRDLVAKYEPLGYTQIELYRTYFWQSIDYRNPEHEIWLGRIFKNGTHTIGGDGMYLNRLSGQIVRSNAMLYHYSRIGTEEQITNRIRTLDKLFHDQKVVDSFDPFSYNVPIEELIHHTAGHPRTVEDFYE